MGTIVHAFDPNQDVWVINTCGDTTAELVLSGTVIRVKGTALVTGTTVLYDVRIGSGTGTLEFEEVDVFVDLTTAMTEYETRLTP